MSEQIDNDQLEIIVEFINEARDLIDELEPTIIGLESMVDDGSDQTSPENSADLNGIFRLFHSIKGGAGFLGFNNIVESTHTAENLLDQLRLGSLIINSRHVDLLCQSCDFTKKALDYVEQNFEDNGVESISKELITKFLENPDDNSIASDASEQPPPQPEILPEPESQPPPPIEIDLDISLDDLVTPETRQRFIEEGDDLLQEIEQDLLAIASNSSDLGPVERLFRNIHSFKGNCGFLGFNDLETLSHSIETLLDLVKSGEHNAVGKVADMLLEMIDVYKESLNNVGQGGKGAIQGLDLYVEIVKAQMPSQTNIASDLAPARLGDILVEQGEVEKHHVDKALETQNKQVGELLVDNGATTPDKVSNALKIQEKLRPPGNKPPAKINNKRQDIRVELDKLDNLINLIGEMVIAENMVINNPDLKGLELENFYKAASHMSKIVRDLQEVAMIIRMIPVSGLFRRMIRLVHDLARKSGKKVDLQLSGESTEVDKTVIEKITDPLVHLIRNSMDHGLEDNDQRLSLGKPQTGVIQLSARHEEGEVLIVIKDDGQGMDRNKLIAKAIEKGLVEGDGSQLSDQEAMKLIFQPGFSTADQVTDISGRGVGMDVVRQNLESIKGRIDVGSVLGKSTTITLRIPLTLAIIDGMLVRTGKANYIIPILSIRESFQPSKDAITLSPDGQELVRVREHLLPVIRLHELHNIEPDSRDLDKGILIVLESRVGQNLCLFVDELMGQQQTVIKGLSNYINKLGDAGGVSGCTILGDGAVCLILDVSALEEIFTNNE